MKYIFITLFFLGLAFVAYFFAWQNYKECRSQNFSRFYCASTHLVR